MSILSKVANTISNPLKKTRNYIFIRLTGLFVFISFVWLIKNSISNKYNDKQLKLFVESSNKKLDSLQEINVEILKELSSQKAELLMINTLLVDLINKSKKI